MSPQDHALELLVSGKSAPQVAAVVGVDARTLRRWKLEPDFARELAEVRKTIHDDIVLRTMALIDQLHDACFENLFWLREMSMKAVSITDRLRCMAAINSNGFRWAKYILDRRDKQNEALLAQTAKPLAKKADTNGRGADATEQTAVSFAPCCENPKSERSHPAPKADINGHRPADSAKTSTTIESPQQGGTGDTAPSSSLAPTTSTQKADINGRGPGATEQTAVPFAPCCEAPKPEGTQPTSKADANGHAIPPVDPELLALKAHRAYRTRLAASKPSLNRFEKRIFAARQNPIAGRV